MHDGALDITNASDLATVSWNRFIEHDKVMLIGSSDGAVADRGKLRVTIHHNLFDRTVQRVPRLRFGQAHVYNNLYITDPATFGYAFGVGIESQIFAEANIFETRDLVAPDRFISRFNGLVIDAVDTLVKGSTTWKDVDVVAEYNAVRDPDLGSMVAWSPSLVGEKHPVMEVRPLVRYFTGPMKHHHFPRP